MIRRSQDDYAERFAPALGELVGKGLSVDTIVVTGGAGFIGATSCGSLLARTRRARGRARQAHLRGQPREPGRRRREPALRVRRKATSPTARRCARSARGSARTAVVNFAAETHVDRSIDDPAAFVRTNVAGTFELLEAARRPPARAADGGLPLPPRLDRRGLRHARRDRRLLRDDALRAELALRRLQGRRRPPRARLPRDLRAAGRCSPTARTTTARSSSPRS